MKQLKSIVHFIAMILFMPFGLVSMLLLFLAKGIGYIGTMIGALFLSVKNLRSPVFEYKMMMKGK
ncbi:hypothetical protein [Dysgonomonas sp. 216]|uniref:hypothetical protein n=1 Tax=Dysgonomonas sp. 216 TaxID=2302934 RepID=UPI0013D1FE43|nr:hypothetical protein [Dysgonomonas sp. 216]